MTALIKQIESEYNQPFEQVIAAYAKDGESIAATASILGFAHRDSFAYWLDKLELRALFSATGTNTNGFKNAALAESRIALSRQKARAILDARIREHGYWFNGHFGLTACHARRLGIEPYNAYRRLRRGMSIEQALTKGDMRKC